MTKAQIMTRAWEIFRTLVGDRIAKLSMALRQAWAEAKAQTSGTEMGWNVKALESMGATRWTKYGKDRLYLSKCGAQIIGLAVDRYNSGNICSAEINGERISNAEANRYMSTYADAYIDMTTGKVCAVYGRHADEFMDALKAYVA